MTRPRGQAESLVRGLESVGAEPLVYPLIRIGPSPDPAAVGEAMGSLEGYDWVVFTSSNGAAAFGRELSSRGKAVSALARLRICAVGRATESAVSAWGGTAALVPARQIAEGVVEALLAAGPGKRVLLARAAQGRDVIPRRLGEAGVVVDDVAFYETLVDDEQVARLRGEMDTASVDAVTFTSGSTVRAFASGAGSALGGAIAASIGPATSAELRAQGIPVGVEAAVHSGEGLVQALIAKLGRAA